MLAILISLAMVGSAFAVMGSSQAITPQTGTVNLNLIYVGPHGQTAASSSTVVNITNYAGTLIGSETTNSPSFKLNYGNYYVDINPSFVLASGYSYKAIANGVHLPITVSASTTSTPIPVYIPINETYPVTVNVTGVAQGSSATISFATLSGFTFEPFNYIQNTTSSVGQFQATLPYGNFYVNANYAGGQYSYLQSFASGQSQINVTLSGTQQVFGYVYDSSGNPLNDISVVIYNTTSNTYSVHHFSGNSFTVFANDWTNKYLIVNTAGYASSMLASPSTGTPHYFNLQKSSSNVYYNYSISNNLKWVNLTLTYKINNGTALPTFGNSTVGSLFLQEQLDQAAFSGFSTYLSKFSDQYTNSTIKVGGYNYNLSKTGTPTVNSLFPLDASVQVSYYNPDVPTSLYSSNFNINVYTLGTKYTPGSFNYNYNITYNNTQIALSSSSTSVTYSRNTILIGPQSSNMWVTLTLTKAQPPAMVDPQISLFWNGMISNNYVLNYSLSNTVFLTPLNTKVSFNVSNAYFDPSTGQKDYPSASFTWKVNNNPAGTGYNNSLTFSQFSNVVNLTAVSPSGVTNYTEFHVYAFNGTPSLNYSATVAGKIVKSGLVSTSQQISLSLPQSSVITFSAYGSNMKVGTTNYYASLGYLWEMPDYKSTAQNISYSFVYPSVKAGVGQQYGYVNVTSVVGSYLNVSFSVYVNDTTSPTPSMQLKDLSGNVVTQPTAGVGTIFDASGSTDPYYPTGLTYNWQVLYPNGTIAPASSSTYQISGGSLNSSSVTLNFLTINAMVVSLKVTNTVGISAYFNKTVSVIIDSPRIVINSIYLAKNLTQGSQSTIWINVTNSGTQSANDFTIALYVGGVLAVTHVYNYLNVSQYKNVSFVWTPATSGHVTLEFRGNNSTEPAFLSLIGPYTTTMTINPPAYRTPLIIGAVIAIIVVVGFVYYKLSTRTKTERKPKQAKPRQPSEQKKPAEKKK